ncbi:AMP-binding protein, partial [Streptomyces fuscichromogenes]|uniref:AMP-binding protein n=1 Tax=Streptomyces fuscichromogenes TaxID=1324013 RepID=UPI001E62B2FF
MIFTSGSTGRPKGVVVEHGSVSGYLEWAGSCYQGLSGRVLLHSSVAFDLAVTSLWAVLVRGGCVLVGEVAEGLGVDLLKATPSHLSLMAEMTGVVAPGGELVVGGEVLTGEVVDGWRATHPGVAVVNEYGPTEATVGCVFQRFAPEEPVDAVVPVGRPIANTRVFVLDSALQLVPPGVAGEL